ncbi:MAG TPA: magnesium-translocating P-type ATPase [Kofleriaceae bacterium]
MIRASARLLELAAAEPEAVYARLATRSTGLSSLEASARLAEYGPNRLARDRPPSLVRLLWRAVRNALVILLAILAVTSFSTGDIGAGVMMVVMLVLSLGLELLQESRAGAAAARLKALIAVRATVHRDNTASEIAVAELVPGDVIELAAGDMLPADVRIVTSKDLFVNQSSLTGESFPVEKHATERAGPVGLEHPTLAFLGTSVASGSALAVVVETGAHTYLASMAASVEEAPPPTAFDRDISKFTRLMLRFMAVLVPLVFAINVVTKGSWTQAFFFAVAVAVGLTPEMLPMIVTVCLAKGAVAMGKKQVIVKHLNAIQNLGAMDVLCTDKTGTLTQDRVVLERYCDVALHDDDEVLALAYTNSHFQTGLRSMLDHAVLAHAETHARARITESVKVDEIPFDFERRIMSVVVRTPEGSDRMISKGAPEAIFPRCVAFELAGERLPMDHAHVARVEEEYRRLSADGFRVLAIATKELPPRVPATYAKSDEVELILRGYLAFFDPPKDTCAVAITELERHGVAIKVITGDNELVARKVCKDVGLATDVVILGPEVEAMPEPDLARAVEAATLFARVSPAHKQRIVRALQANGHTVGFMGDGINDAPALHAADVGISVDTAVDIAKATADLILLERSLRVLDEGVLEGRKVFANISKYVRMGASSNFGNMFSVLGASIFVPFLPMLPIQILTNNLLYDLGQTTIPTDSVDTDQIQRPRPWNMRALTRFIAVFGPCSSLFDYTTFCVLLFGFRAGAGLFQTGWFVESLLTQTLIIHVIRTHRIPFIQSRASWPVLAMGLAVSAVGIALPFSPIASYLGFVPLPAAYWPVLLATLACYLTLTQGVKMWLVKRGWL